MALRDHIHDPAQLPPIERAYYTRERHVHVQVETVGITRRTGYWWDFLRYLAAHGRLSESL